MREIHVFYHVFTVNHWRHVLESHIEQLRRSGLYDACRHVHVGAVYTGHRDLSELDSALLGHDKISVYFTRKLSAAPTIWRSPEVRCDDGRIGECETILRMTEFAQHHDPDAIYCFFHSKGVTNPPTKQRKHLPYLVGRGFDPSGSNEQANAFVLQDLNTVVSSWKEYVKALETTRLRHYLYNFFWISGELLRDFDFEEYVRRHRELAPPQQRPHRLGIDGNTTRHLFSLFPIKLYAFKHGLEMSEPPYAYVDVAM